MSLTDFFRINLPYGIKRNKRGEWFAFNREYMPLGWNSTVHKKSISDDNVYSDYPIYTSYKGITEAKLKKLAQSIDSMHLDENGKIKAVFFYNDGTNPQSNPAHWKDYLDKLKILSTFEV